MDFQGNVMFYWKLWNILHLRKTMGSPPLGVSNVSFVWKVCHGLIWGVVKASLWWPHECRWLTLLEQQKGKCGESQQRYRFGLRKKVQLGVQRTFPRKVRTSRVFRHLIVRDPGSFFMYPGNMKAVVDMNTVLRNRWCSVPHRCLVKILRCRQKELCWKITSFRVNQKHQNALHLHCHKKNADSKVGSLKVEGMPQLFFQCKSSFPRISSTGGTEMFCLACQNSIVFLRRLLGAKPSRQDSTRGTFDSREGSKAQIDFKGYNKKGGIPGDSSRDLFIPDRWRSLANWKGSLFPPS